jgi:hypothetical protein
MRIEQQQMKTYSASYLQRSCAALRVLLCLSLREYCAALGTRQQQRC